MQIIVSGKHIHLTPPMEEFASKKCERLFKFYDRITKIDVVVGGEAKDFEVEGIVHVNQHDPFVARSKGPDFYACVDGLVDKLTRQITEYKDRVRNRKHTNESADGAWEKKSP